MSYRLRPALFRSTNTTILPWMLGHTDAREPPHRGTYEMTVDGNSSDRLHLKAIRGDPWDRHANGQEGENAQAFVRDVLARCTGFKRVVMFVVLDNEIYAGGAAESLRQKRRRIRLVGAVRSGGSGRNRR